MDYLKFKSRLQHSGTVEVNGQTLQHGGAWENVKTKYIDKIPLPGGGFRYVYEKAKGMRDYARSAAANGIQSARSVAGNLRERANNAMATATKYGKAARMRGRLAKSHANAAIDEAKKTATKYGKAARIRGRLAKSHATSAVGEAFDNAVGTATKYGKAARIRGRLAKSHANAAIDEAKKTATKYGKAARIRGRLAKSHATSAYNDAVGAARKAVGRAQFEVGKNARQLQRDARFFTTHNSRIKSAKKRVSDVNAFIADRAKRLRKRKIRVQE